jgi:hypothetical protein
VKKFIQNAFAACKRAVGLFMVAFAIALAVSALTGTASAQTDITSTISTVSGYWDAVKVVAIAILLFVIGRRVVRKM